MSDQPWYARYPGDFQSKTRHLTMLERGAYSDLIDHYYITRKPLPADNSDGQIYRACGAFSKSEQTAVDRVLAEFFTLESDGYHNKRVDEELEKAVRKSEKAREAARRRWDADAYANALLDEHAPSICETDAQSMLSQPQLQPQSKPTPKTLTDSGESASLVVGRNNRKLSAVQSERFTRFWNAFAYKRGKADAAEAWRKLNPNDLLTEEIIAKAKREAAVRAEVEASGRVPIMAQGWLSGRRFEDDLPSHTPKTNGQGEYLK